MKFRILLAPLLLSTACLPLGAAADMQQAAMSPPIVASNTTLSASEKKMVAWIDKRQAEIINELTTHIGMNTGTDNIAGIDRYRTLLAAELEKLGFVTSEHSVPAQDVISCEGSNVQFASQLLAKRTGKKQNKVLLNGHMDTVFSSDDEFQSLTIEADGTLKGPGIADMKGGIVALLYALRALDGDNRLDESNVTILLNSDEEIGSLSSRPLIEEQARLHDVGLIFEPSHNNHMTRSRKGLGQVRLKVTGRESHAGAAHEQGVSANLEMAHKVIAIEALTDYEANNTVNVGTLSGGEKRNTIPGCADAYIDLRYPSKAAGEGLVKAIKAITSKASITNERYPEFPYIDIWANLHRPAKPEHAQVDAMLAEAMGLSVLLGEPVIGTNFSGGGTDGSLSQAVGLPTIDSLGLDGVGAHSSREKSSIKSLMARTRLAAVMIGRQIDKARQ